MSITRRAALAAAGLAAVAAPLVAATGQAQAYTGTPSCYQLTMAPYSNPTLVSYADQTRIKAERAGLDATASRTGHSVFVCGSYATIYTNFRYDPIVAKMTWSNATSVVAGNYTVQLPSSDIITIPERSPYYLAGLRAQEYGLEVIDDGIRTHIIVRGNPADVYEAFDGYSIRKSADATTMPV